MLYVSQLRESLPQAIAHAVFAELFKLDSNSASGVYFDL